MLQASYQSDKSSTLTGEAEPDRNSPVWGRLVGALLLMVVAGAAVWNVMADSAVVTSVSTREQITSAGINIGDVVNLENGWNSWQGGFLDTKEKTCVTTKFCVSTSATPDRHLNSGRWEILSASEPPKANGSPLQNGDLIHLRNKYNGFGGYLDVYKKGCDGASSHCVSTSDSDNRDRGSGTWKIIADVTDITSSTAVKLLNIFNGENGGYLDVNGNGCFGNVHCVVTSVGPTRHGQSTSWRISPDPIPQQ